MSTVYIETTIIGYLTSRPQRDLIVAGRQQLTREWWDGSRLRFEGWISEAVLAEISAGDPVAAAERLAAVEDVPVLGESDEIEELASKYKVALGLPDRAAADAVHMAYAVAYEFDYMVTWNCTHIANAETVKRLVALNRALGRVTPLICTPESLMEAPEVEHDE